MGAGVAHGIHRVQVGQVVAFLPGIEGKFQHLHARIAGILQQLPDAGGHKAQILGDKIQLRQRLLHRPYEVNPRPLDPGAVSGGFVPGGHCPVAFKAPEVVKAHHVIHMGGGGQPLNPPAVARFRHGLPVVNGVAPELAVGGEAVRRAARHHLWVPGLVQLEEAAVDPHVRRVQRHINGHVADDANALAVGVGPQSPPLLPELILNEALVADFLPVFLSGLLQRILPAQP